MGGPPRPVVTSPLARCLLVVAVLVVGGSVRAQSHLAPRPGPFVVIDLYASPFQLGLERKAVGGAVGYRVGGGIDLALRIEHESEEVFPRSSDRVIELPGQTLVGVEASLAFGPDRAPWRAVGAAGVAWAGRSDPAYSAEGGPAFRSGRRLSQTHAVASLSRYVRVDEGPMAVYLGGGAYVEARRRAAETTVYGAGGPDERAVRTEGRTDWTSGVVLTVPVVVRLGEQATLTFEPTVRVMTAALVYGFAAADGHVAVRLAL